MACAKVISSHPSSLPVFYESDVPVPPLEPIEMALLAIDKSIDSDEMGSYVPSPYLTGLNPPSLRLSATRATGSVSTCLSAARAIEDGSRREIIRQVEPPLIIVNDYTGRGPKSFGIVFTGGLATAREVSYSPDEERSSGSGTISSKTVDLPKVDETRKHQSRRRPAPLELVLSSSGHKRHTSNIPRVRGKTCPQTDCLQRSTCLSTVGAAEGRSTSPIANEVTVIMEEEEHSSSMSGYDKWMADSRASYLDERTRGRVIERHEDILGGSTITGW